MHMLKVISDTKHPVKIWASDLEPEAEKQVRNIASLPFIHSHVAVMPDAHAGKGSTVGTVIATKGAIIPAAVGVDIGCGMCAVKLPFKAEDLIDLATLRHSIERVVPTSTNQPKKKKGNRHFHKYNGVENIKWLPNFFTENNTVVIQEKLHGTNARCGILPYQATTLFKKIKKLLGLTPKYEFCYGSNNVDLTDKPGNKGYYGEDIYGKVFAKMNVSALLNPGEVIYGEIIGPGIQKDYDYSLREHKFVLFDVKKDGKWLLPDEVAIFAINKFELVPTLYKGFFNKDEAYKLTFGPSKFDSNTKIREGIVIKDAVNYNNTDGSKRALKWVSEDYLADPTNTDNH